jgi:ribosome-associated translation inhibitor RaiA
MEIAPLITFRGVDGSQEITDDIQRRAQKLDALHPHILICRVAVEKDPEDQRSGSPYRVRVVVRVPPGKEMVGRRETGQGETHEPLTVAIRDAFEAVRRQLLKIKDKQQGNVKTDPNRQMVGHVVRLFPEQGYGFIRTLEGREIYFHRNADRGAAMGTGGFFLATGEKKAFGHPLRVGPGFDNFCEHSPVACLGRRSPKSRPA